MSAQAAAAMRAVPDIATPHKETDAGGKQTGKRSKTRLRELAAEVDKMQDRLSDLDDERKAIKTQITATIKQWNEEAAKRK